MKPESQPLLARAQQSLREARICLEAAETEPFMFHASARASYYAAFHSARVPIFERTGKATKTHSGVNTLFSQLALNEPEFDVKLRAFLSASYAYKTIADYEWTPEIRVTRARAIELLDVSHQFVATKTAILAA